MNPAQLNTLLSLREKLDDLRLLVTEVIDGGTALAEPAAPALLTEPAAPAPAAEAQGNAHTIMLVQKHPELKALHNEVGAMLVNANLRFEFETLARIVNGSAGWEFKPLKSGESLRAIVRDYEGRVLYTAEKYTGIVNPRKLAHIRGVLAGLGVSTLNTLLTAKGGAK